jgi:hypothetical protein
MQNACLIIPTLRYRDLSGPAYTFNLGLMWQEYSFNIDNYICTVTPWCNTTSLSCNESLWTEIPCYTVFQFTLTVNVPPQITSNKHWCYVRVWLIWFMSRCEYVYSFRNGANSCRCGGIFKMLHLPQQDICGEVVVAVADRAFPLWFQMTCRSL